MAPRYIRGETRRGHERRSIAEVGVEAPRPAAVRPHQVARVVWLRRQRLVRPGRARRYLPPRAEGAETFLGA